MKLRTIASAIARRCELLRLGRPASAAFASSRHDLRAQVVCLPRALSRPARGLKFHSYEPLTIQHTQHALCLSTYAYGIASSVCTSSRLSPTPGRALTCRAPTAAAAPRRRGRPARPPCSSARAAQMRGAPCPVCVCVCVCIVCVDVYVCVGGGVLGGLKRKGPAALSRQGHACSCLLSRGPKGTNHSVPQAHVILRRPAPHLILVVVLVIVRVLALLGLGLLGLLLLRNCGAAIQVVCV